MTKDELKRLLEETDGDNNAFSRLEKKVAVLAKFLLEHKVTPR
jgi:hypothetical protein